MNSELKVGALVKFGTRVGTVTRVWDRPHADPYVTLRTAAGKTFVRCASCCMVLMSADHVPPF